MALITIDILTRQDLEEFKKELFDEIRKKGSMIQKKDGAREWLKSYEVRKLLNISPNTLHSLRIKGLLPYKKVGGLMYYRYDDIRQLMEEIRL